MVLCPHIRFVSRTVAGKICMSALYACIMMLTVASATSLQDCEADMTGFELVTGYVFTAPDDLLDSIPGTLMLTDCLEACQSNDTCYSVNYETGLCVMFSSNADAYPGKYIYIIQNLPEQSGRIEIHLKKKKSRLQGSNFAAQGRFSKILENLHIFGEISK